MSFGECYVCFGENAPISSCLCKTLYIHEHCQLESIRKCNSLACSVCKTDYTNIKIKKKRVLKIKPGTFIIISLGISSFAISVIGIQQLVFYLLHFWRSTLLQVLSPICLVVGALFGLCAGSLYRRLGGNLIIIETRIFPKIIQKSNEGPQEPVNIIIQRL